MLHGMATWIWLSYSLMQEQEHGLVVTLWAAALYSNQEEEENGVLKYIGDIKARFSAAADWSAAAAIEGRTEQAEKGPIAEHKFRL